MIDRLPNWLRRYESAEQYSEDPKKRRNWWAVFILAMLLVTGSQTLLHAYAHYTDGDEASHGLALSTLSILKLLFTLRLFLALFESIRRFKINQIIRAAHSGDEFETYIGRRAVISAANIFALLIIAVMIATMIMAPVFGPETRGYAFDFITGNVLLFHALTYLFFWHNHPNSEVEV